MSFAQVHLDVPLKGPFDYRVGPYQVVRGSIVVVPFRNKKMVGIVDRVSDVSLVEPRRLKEIESVFDFEPLSPSFFSLCQFVSQYYCAQMGQALFLGLPKAVRRIDFLSRFTQTVFTLSDKGLHEVPAYLTARTIGKRRLFNLLSQGAIMLPQALAVYSSARLTLTQWHAKSWIDTHEQRQNVVSPKALMTQVEKEDTKVIKLTTPQSLAVEAIIANLDMHQTWLVQGVTGSGKTEVYFEIMAKTLDLNRQVLVLVPEINLTPQFESRLRKRFPQHEIVTLNSSMTDKERYQAWALARSGSASIVLGTRLAVFVSLPRLGLIVVDEEHDLSYKQVEGIRYNARDLAIYVANQQKVPIVLGSATPSIETYFNVVESRYKRLVLEERPQGPLPDIELIPIERAQSREISPEILNAIQKCLDKGEQVLVFINRRGYASALFCSSCNWVAMCARCSARLTIHHHSSRLRCHYCGYQSKVPDQCAECGNQDLIDLGQGTQRVEEALRAQFSSASILRIDSDTTKRKGVFKEMRGVIEKSKVDIIVGTQMLAKGHDFPNLSLVVIMGTDQSLFSSDFRATERLYQQLLQVSGRPGRGKKKGRVMLQTEFSQHPVYQSLVHQTFDEFAQQLLSERKEAAFPPYCYQVLLRVSGKQEIKVWKFLSRAHKEASRIKVSGLEVYDAVPSPIFKMSGLYRAQILIQAASRKSVREFLSVWSGYLEEFQESTVRYVLDVDPLDV
ncbi:MAG: primosomal protein N' [Proteobacteria bacterium]|nr:primosomal protein N' [Pseudomonadota bacterium]